MDEIQDEDFIIKYMFKNIFEKNYKESSAGWTLIGPH